MLPFSVTVLGCGSALPTLRHNGSAQMVNIHDKLFLVDCAEAVQVALRRERVHLQRLSHIFITHLHGDHCFGLPGLVSTLGLLGRTAPLHLYGPPDIEPVFRPLLSYFCPHLGFPLCFHSICEGGLVYNDRTVEVHAVPLQHRVPCFGFLFREKPSPPHIRPEAVERYAIPIPYMHLIKAGNDITLPDGRVIPNSELTRPAPPPRSFAYCSDTRFDPAIAPLVEGVDLLYHEATYAEADSGVCQQVFHSTASQAARMACLCHARQLLIGHFSTRYDDEQVLLDEARALFPNTLLAAEGLTIHIAPPCA